MPKLNPKGQETIHPPVLGARRLVGQKPLSKINHMFMASKKFSECHVVRSVVVTGYTRPYSQGSLPSSITLIARKPSIESIIKKTEVSNTLLISITVVHP
ncbi:hypothetical protein RND81_13G005800 [Saponaria officinalis]|uniref:Uncharacterized protein n=1 Tax=Saponaria officinalis TaxID=3572 RepID=A0AAW1GYW9_SAPOF